MSLRTEFPKFMDGPTDYELLECTQAMARAENRLKFHANRIKRLRQTERFGVRLGYQWGEWEVILCDRERAKR